MFIGFTLLIVGFILMMWFGSNLNKPRYSKPMAFSNPIFIGIGTILWLSLIFAGIAIIFRTSKNIGTWTLVASVVFYLMVKLAGGSKSTRRTMLNTYQKMKVAYPEYNEQEILCKVLKTRYSSWDDEEIRNFVEDSKNINDLINIVIYHETGRYPVSNS